MVCETYENNTINVVYPILDMVNKIPEETLK